MGSPRGGVVSSDEDDGGGGSSAKSRRAERLYIVDVRADVAGDNNEGFVPRDFILSLSQDQHDHSKKPRLNATQLRAMEEAEEEAAKGEAEKAEILRSHERMTKESSQMGIEKWNASFLFNIFKSTRSSDIKVKEGEFATMPAHDEH